MKKMLQLVRIAFLLGMVCVPACALQGQTIYWLSDTRYVSVSGNAQTPPGNPAAYAYSQNSAPGVPGFSGNQSGAADVTGPGPNESGGTPRAHADSAANQYSELNGSGLSFNAFVSAITGGWNSGSPELCYAEAISSLQVSFSVAVASSWTMTVDCLPYGNAALSWDLISAEHGSVLGDPLSWGPRTYGGQLLPGDIYTLNFYLAATSNTPNPFGHLSSASQTITFSVVPEPSTGLLLGVGLLALIWHRARKVHAAHAARLAPIPLPRSHGRR
jgi:hypothetical protein